MAPKAERARIDWMRCIPFFALHVGVLAAFATGVSPVAVWTAFGLYVVRMFAIAGFYHRYFSHRTYRTSRPFQFAMALAGTSAVQRGPIWWASQHRHHHRFSDQPEDEHSPRQHGFWWSHMGWFMTRSAFRTKSKLVRDLEKFPELRFVDRFDWLVPILLAVGLFVTGEVLANSAPGLGTDGWQMFVWGFLVSTVVLYHATYTINSFAHRFGRRRFDTADDSRNNFWLALLTLGEGWHNNHHHHPGTVRQGFYWWEIDIAWYGLRFLSLIGLVRDLRPVPARVLDEAVKP